MDITVAKSAGFCFGVDRAVKMVNDLLDKNMKVCTLGPIIHNRWMVDDLNRRGARIVETPTEAKNGETLVIRAHGIEKSCEDEIIEKGLTYVDTTCPFVKKIHHIVSKADKNDIVLIAGDKVHPEIKGIIGHCNSKYFTFNSFEELKEITNNNPNIINKSVVVVAQTTFNTEIWEKCNDFIRKVYTNSRFFDTICSATSIRQHEAKKIAAESDLMIIIGGKHSSNTEKLFNVCAEICPSYKIEGAEEISSVPFKYAKRVGVTAGASTPACIIKEVLIAMSEQDNMDKDFNDISFEEALEKSFKTVNNDDTVKGTVIGFSGNEVQIDIGTKHAGYIPLAELTDDANAKPQDLVSEGDVLDLVVMRVNDQEGTVQLSKKRFDAVKGWADIVKASEDNTIVEGVVTDVIKGGVLASVNGVKIFIPASQSGVGRDEKLEKILHQTVKMYIIEINKPRRRAVGSIRQVLREARKELAAKVWDEIEDGKEYTGVVKSLTSYGAFVDLGGVDGMVHVSELSWSRIKNPSEVVNVGDKINVFVKSFDKETKKISLGYKDKGDDPFTTFTTKFNVGDITDAKIVSFMPFGAFAQIMPGVDGLIHISQIADQHIVKPQDVLTMGEDVKVKIIEIDSDKKRISLSMREANASAEEVAADEVVSSTDEN